jgi:hypothetical protein
MMMMLIDCLSLSILTNLLFELVYYKSEQLMLDMLKITSKPNSLLTGQDAEKMLMVPQKLFNCFDLKFYLVNSEFKIQFLDRVRHFSEVAKCFADWIRIPATMELFLSESQHDTKRRDLIQRTLNQNTFFDTLKQYWDRFTQQSILLTLGKYDF